MPSDQGILKGIRQAVTAVKGSCDVGRRQGDNIRPNLRGTVCLRLEEAALLPPRIPCRLNGGGAVGREVRVIEWLDNLLLTRGGLVLVAGKSGRGGRFCLWRGLRCRRLLLLELLLGRELRGLVGLGLFFLVWSAQRGSRSVSLTKQPTRLAGLDTHHSSWAQAHPPVRQRKGCCLPFLRVSEMCSVETMERQQSKKL